MVGNNAYHALGLEAAMNSSANIVVKFTTACNGAWIEETPTTLGTTRVWRFTGNHGQFAEWAEYDDFVSSNPSPRFYGSQFKANDFVLC